MIESFGSLVLFLVPVIALGWRIVVSKTRQHWIKAGAAAAAMATLVGAFVVFGSLETFHFRDWRADIGLLAAMSGSVYLIMWSLRKHSNRRHRTLSLMAAIIGLVPVVGIVISTVLQAE